MKCSSTSPLLGLLLFRRGRRGQVADRGGVQGVEHMLQVAEVPADAFGVAVGVAEDEVAGAATAAADVRTQSTVGQRGNGSLVAEASGDASQLESAGGFVGVFDAADDAFVDESAGLEAEQVARLLGRRQDAGVPLAGVAGEALLLKRRQAEDRLEARPGDKRYFRSRAVDF